MMSGRRGGWSVRGDCVIWVVRWSGVHFRGYLLEVCFPALSGVLLELQGVRVSA